MGVAMNTSEKRSILQRTSPTQWLALVLTILAVIFILQNRGKVSIDILAITITSPMWVALLAIFLVGWAAGVLTMRRRR
jgi:lipopolysaccharide assembly protein A